MDMQTATRAYETWLGEQTTIVKADLKRKHKQMALALFPFLRATFYRWVERWPEVCAELTGAPQVLAVGDLHIENFGTWRDREGRLVWGVNDFDEAGLLPYTNDLVRLATSAHLAIAANHLKLAPGDACAAILEGYTSGLASGGRPFVLAERRERLRAMVMSESRNPVTFWQKLAALPTTNAPVPKSALAAIDALWPEEGISYRLVERVAGLGSLGRQRFVGIGEWRGGKVAREAKASVPSALVWAGVNKDDGPNARQALAQAVRAPDPFFRTQAGWLARRLAPDCGRVELTALPKRRDEYRLLRAMGRETANVHLGTRAAIKAIIEDLTHRPARWLHTSAERMAQATTDDWHQWRQSV